MSASLATAGEERTGLFAHFGRDFTASIVVFLVAMPLCMGIAIASGVPPEKGLVTGIIGGIVVGLVSGSPLQVSGPAAGERAVESSTREKERSSGDLVAAGHVAVH